MYAIGTSNAIRHEVLLPDLPMPRDVQAGRLAASDASPSNRETQTKVTASHACTPNSRLRMSIDVPSEHNSPILSPAKVSHTAWRITRLYMEPRYAPSAIRTPISRVLWPTE